MIAVLSDMDGVLVDSHTPTERVWTAWAARHELDVPTVIRTMHGRPSAETVAALRPDLDAEREGAAIDARQAADTAGIAAIPGAHDLLTTHPRVAVVTSATEPLAKARLTAAGLPIPAHLVTPERLARGKPDPEGYLLAARLLGASPAECVVFEDAPAGIRAAKAANMLVVALTTSHAVGDLREADLLVEDLGRWPEILARLRPSSSGDRRTGP